MIRPPFYTIPSKGTTTRPQVYPQSLPLISFTKNLLGIVDLSKTLILCSQHILPTTLTLFSALFELGLNRGNISIIGKCYSTNPAIYSQMIDQGIDVDPSSLEFDFSLPFDSIFRKNILNFIKRQLRKYNFSSFEKIILIDDGGVLISEFSQASVCNSNIVCVEQTTSGYNLLKSIELKVPVINIARSEAKLIYESPIIADIVVSKMFQHIRSLEIIPKKILIVGNGAVGKSIASILSNDFDLSIYDVNLKKPSINKIDFEKSIYSQDLIIGCTGKNAFSKINPDRFYKETVFASASSSDREFNSCTLRKKSDGIITSCHQNVQVGKVHLLNCGFPINFDDHWETVDSNIFQLTRSLILAGVLQAYFHNGIGFEIIPLDIDLQFSIIDRFKSIYPFLAKQETI